MNTTQHYNFNHLSVKDLVEARDLFHIHLTNKKNVVATAIGRYLVRISDFDKNGNYNPAKKKGKRTLADSIVTSFSWPCILVFVEKWEEKSALIKNDGNDIVPKSLYMPDGRIVPVCIVEAEKQIRSSSNVDINKFIFPNNYIGGGFPLLLNSQGDERVATVGCVVSDGHKYYALTNRHVTGDGGEKVSSIFGTTKMKIGTSAGNHLGAVKFSQIYPGWEDKSTVVNCDAGLVEIDDRKRWKTDILGLGQMGPLFDLNVNNLSLGIISEHKLDKRRKRITVSGKLKAYGAGTGLMNGEVIAMFYRYKSVGGTEYISDFLIGGINGTDLKVHHGNSGMLWMIEVLNDKNKLELQPLALHWGQHEFISGNQKSRYSYSLSTSLSVICREMNVDLVRGWNLDNDYSWGKVGHYTVAASAILLNAIKDENLKKLLKNNIANISFDIANISKHLDDKNKDKSDLQNLSRNPKNPDNPFCALADVPDIVWKQIKTDKAPWGRKGHENPNHYADVDAPTKDGSKNLFAKCKIPTDLTTETLMDYYKNIDNEKTGIANVERITEELKKEREERTGIKPIASDPVHHYGLIFFRVWQIYNYMVKALKEEKDVAKFLFAAGVSAHYWGDACQPLHSSYMSDGNPKDAFKDKYTAKKDSPKTSKDPHKKGDVYSILTNPGKGVHVAFEDKMIDKYIDEKILPGLRTILEDINSSINKVTIESMLSGQEAGFALLKLMEKTQEKLPPITIVEAYKKAKEEKIDVPTALYEQFGDKTVECLALGSRYLTAFWEAAWKAGSGSTNITSLEKVNEKALIDLYSVTTELPSMYLNDVDTVLDDNKSVTTKKSSTAKSGKKTKT